MAVSLKDGVAGVYALLYRGEVVYIGKTINIFSRVSDHYRGMQRKRRGIKPPFGTRHIDIPIFDEVQAKRCRIHDLDKEEIALIQKYRPRYNIKMNREPIHDKLDLTQQPFFLNLLAKKAVPKLEVKRRRLPVRVQKVEHQFREFRDPRMKITLPKLKFLEEDARA